METISSMLYPVPPFSLAVQSPQSRPDAQAAIGKRMLHFHGSEFSPNFSSFFPIHDLSSCFKRINSALESVRIKCYPQL